MRHARARVLVADDHPVYAVATVVLLTAAALGAAVAVDAAEDDRDTDRDSRP